MRQTLQANWTLCATALFVAVATGCGHKPLPPPPPAATAPPVTSSTVTVITPMPALPATPTAVVVPEPKPKPVPPPVEPPVHHKRKRHKAPVTKPEPESKAADNAAGTAGGSAAGPGLETATQAAGGVPETAAGGGASANPDNDHVPGLGQLSAGTAISGKQRARIMAEIKAQQERLSKLPAAATSDIATTQLLIQNFLAKARQAVDQNDLDGAETLNTKARVLLDELQGG